MKLKAKEIRIKGIPICRGIAIGKPFFFHIVEESVPNFSLEEADVDKEIHRYRQALNKSRDDVRRLQKQLEIEQILEGAAILDAQLQMMYDPSITSGAEKDIQEKQKNAEYIFNSIIKSYKKKFDSIADPFFRERFKDIQDISRRVMSHLLESVRITLSDIPPGSIIFAQELTTSDIAESKSSSVVGFVSHLGGTTSHAAIVAKAKGMPYITSIDYEALENFKDCDVIADGRTGELIVNPSFETMTAYKALQEQLNCHLDHLEKMESLTSETYDGYRMRLSANIESSSEVDLLHQYGGNGVGLFRSEYAFNSNQSFPSEEEQYRLYKNIIEKMQGLPIVIRTFDVGGDKFLAKDMIAEESNPYLGCRAIRFLLKESQIFKSQISAILRASIYGDVSIMFPMISSLSELKEAKALIEEVRADLKSRGISIAEKLRIGCMIEVPSAAVISDLLAQECDFLSIGTNDLIQYALAVDRGNHFLSNLYTPTHPSVLRLIRYVVHEANHHGIPVTVCGEMAADPRFTPLLLGLGVHELSVAARYLPVVKNAIRNISIVSAAQLAEKALSLTTAQEIQQLLDIEYRQSVPYDVFYNV